MLRNVAVVVVNGFLPFEFGTICEVFGVDRADDGLPSYDFAVVAGEPAPLRAHNDFTIQPPYGLERLEEADLIALPAVGDDRLCIYADPNPKTPKIPKIPEPDPASQAARRAGCAPGVSRRPAAGAASGGGSRRAGAERVQRGLHPG